MDMSDALRQAADDLEASYDDVHDECVQTTKRAGGEMTRDARKRVQGLSSAPAYPYSIGFDVELSGSKIHMEFGPDKDKRQGALGNLIEFASGDASNRPIPHVGPAFHREVDTWRKFIARSLDKVDW